MIYVEQHNLEEVFSGLVERCFTQRVVDPKRFILNHLLSEKVVDYKEIKELRKQNANLRTKVQELTERIAILQYELAKKRDAAKVDSVESQGSAPPAWTI